MKSISFHVTGTDLDIAYYAVRNVCFISLKLFNIFVRHKP